MKGLNVIDRIPKEFNNNSHWRNQWDFKEKKISKELNNGIQRDIKQKTVGERTDSNKK